MKIKNLLSNKINICLIILLTLLVMLIAYSVAVICRDTIYNGIFIDGIDVSGLKLEETRSLLEEKSKDEGNEIIVLKYKDYIWNYELKDISYRLETEEALKKAYSSGRTGNVFERLNDIIRLKHDNLMVTRKASYDQIKTKEILMAIKKKLDKDSKDAKLKYDNGSIKFDKEIIGNFLDIDINAKMLENNILERNFTSIALNVKDIKPKITYDDIKDIKYVTSYFSTAFNTEDINRSYNIRLACERINGTVLLPKEVFSMDKALGSRTAENGYREAPVIYKNELVKGTGGGVCQVTTTLYNSVLLSKLKVIERTHHSMPLGYVKPGQDATIAENYIDFKFENSNDYAIAINADVEENKINIRLLERKNNDNIIIKLVSDVVEEYAPQGEELIVDDSLVDGQRVVSREPRNGLKSNLYRDTYNTNGQLLKREKISEDIYNPVKPQIKVNQSTYNRLKG